MQDAVNPTSEAAGESLDPREAQIQSVKDQLTKLRQDIRNTAPDNQEDAPESVEQTEEVNVEQALADLVREAERVDALFTDEENADWEKVKQDIVDTANEQGLAEFAEGLVPVVRRVDEAHTELGELAAEVNPDTSVEQYKETLNVPKENTLEGFERAIDEKLTAFIGGQTGQKIFGPVVAFMRDKVGFELSVDGIASFAKELLMPKLMSNEIAQAFFRSQGFDVPDSVSGAVEALFGDDRLHLSEKLALSGQEPVKVQAKNKPVSISATTLAVGDKKYRLKEGDTQRPFESIEPLDANDQSAMRLVVEGKANNPVMLTDLLDKVASGEPLQLDGTDIAIEEIV